MTAMVHCASLEDIGTEPGEGSERSGMISGLQS